MNNQLKAKIIEHYGKQWIFAKELGVDDTIVSRIVTGARKLSETEKIRWAEKLKTTVEIFDHETIV